MLPPELELLVWCGQLDCAQDERARELLGRGLDWPLLRKMALYHGVLPLLYTRLKELGGDLVPAAEMAQLRALYVANAQRNLRLTQKLRRILDLLAAQGIEALPFKGPVLAAAAYGDVALRQFVDLDILVRQRDARKAKELLAAGGYRWVHNCTAAQEDIHLARTCEYSFVSPDGGGYLDVHWRFAAEFLTNRMEAEEVFSRQREVYLEKWRVPAPGDEDMLLYLCLHGTFHLWTRLSYISDVARLFTVHGAWDWPALLSKAEQAGLRRMFHLGLALARDLYAAKLPGDIEAAIKRDRTLQALRSRVLSRLAQLEADEPDFGEVFRFHLKSKELRRDQVKYVLIRALFPTVEDWDRLRLPEGLHFVYYFLRPLRLVRVGLIQPSLRRLAPRGRQRIESE